MYLLIEIQEYGTGGPKPDIDMGKCDSRSKTAIRYGATAYQRAAGGHHASEAGTRYVWDCGGDLVFFYIDGFQGIYDMR